MKISIVGAGGIGGYYAARLINSGLEPLLIARGAHLEALQRSGLAVSHPEFQFHQPVTAMTFEDFLDAHRPDELDLICLAVKAQVSAEFATALASWMRDCNHPPAVMSPQNGVDSEIHLAEHLGQDCVIGALAVGIGAHVTQPGTIEATGPGKIVMGAWPNTSSAHQGPATERLPALEATLSTAQVPTEVTDDIRRELWRKLIINNGVNPLSALTGLDTRELSTHPDFMPVVRALMHETVRASHADDVTLTTEDADAMLSFIQGFDPIKTSMLVDREKGRPLEIEPICGAVLTRSQRLGLDAPATQLVTALLRRL